jgi:hypothetical protein
LPRTLRDKVEIVDESVATAILDAVTKSNDHVAHRSLPNPRYPGWSQRLTSGGANDSRFARCAKWVAVF